MLGANLEDFTIDQFAGALALSLGAVGSLLLVIWQSKCHCKMNLCYIFSCERKPPPTNDTEDPEEAVIPKATETQPSNQNEPEPEPAPDILP